MNHLINQIYQYDDLHPNEPAHLAIHLDNGKHWLETDRVATELGWVLVPVPHFFTQQQINHMLDKAAVNCVVCHESIKPFYESLGFSACEDYSQGICFLSRKKYSAKTLHHGTHKITFTSGSTGTPKGVCLSKQHLSRVGQSLAGATAEFNLTKHISLLPYSVLLENMAAHYANDYAELEIISPPLADVGLTGSGQFDVKKLVDALLLHQPDSMIMMPQMLKQLISYQISVKADLSFIKFIAVGGAVCTKSTIEQAHHLGLPVYQGYGISECGSVITLDTNTIAPGTVGKALAHCDLTLAEDGEIEVTGPMFLGYLGEEEAVDSQENATRYKTGDMGYLNDQNELIITGRKKNIIINSFGRNIMPDWIEGALLSINGIFQAVVYGEGKPFISALIVTQLNPNQLNRAITQLNQTLPDYARIEQYLTVQPFTVADDMLTNSGKTKPFQIIHHYKDQLENLYATSIKKQANAI
ncbi:AMP-binding protein [Marinicella sp. S1101]|uniref:AMP-binding protein n=1 Tax=Marinicella marina TaxID=2996016 RepID=UPI002260AF52|nr:AMP-binding protein [Marinicella marina]MCX7554201.1 AMP-binding protein [Marinicella marina]MDJ1141106.1 AMP-binding protein [Marinicella marina]